MLCWCDGEKNDGDAMMWWEVGAPIRNSPGARVQYGRRISIDQALARSLGVTRAGPVVEKLPGDPLHASGSRPQQAGVACVPPTVTRSVP
jgi:hypothetical protein